MFEDGLLGTKVHLWDGFSEPRFVSRGGRKKCSPWFPLDRTVLKGVL